MDSHNNGFDSSGSHVPNQLPFSQHMPSLNVQHENVNSISSHQQVSGINTESQLCSWLELWSWSVVRMVVFISWVMNVSLGVSVFNSVAQRVDAAV